MKYLLILAIIFWTYNIYSQETSLDAPDDLPEEIIPEIADENYESTIYDNASELIENINESDIHSLLLIPGIDISTAEAITKYRKEHGYIFSLTELSFIEGVDKALLKIIMAYMRIDRRNQHIEDLNRTTGITPLKIVSRNRYLYYPENISPKIYNRIDLTYSKISTGVVIEKDKGEKNYLDYSSFHLSYSDTGFVNQAIIGDYDISFGCGLVFGNMYKSYKTSDVLFPLSSNRTIINPHRSAEENKYLRGSTVTLRLSGFFLTGFYSNVKIDTHKDSNNVITSFPFTGIHISAHELDGRKNSQLITSGITGGYENKVINLSFLIAQSNTKENIIESSHISKNNLFISGFYTIRPNEELKISGETALQNKNFNTIHILNLKMRKGIYFISSLRRYSGRFTSYYGGAFGEGYNMGNDETGFYNGVKLNHGILNVDLFYDQFRINGASSVSGDEFLLRTKIKLFGNNNIRATYRFRTKTIEPDESDTRHILSFDAETIFSKTLKNKIRIDYRISEAGSKGSGYLIYDDISFSLSQTFQSAVRFIVFSSLSSGVINYEYEKDLPGMFSSQILSGDGFRWYAYFSYTPIKSLRFSMKISETYRDGVAQSYLNFQSDLSI